LANVLSEKIWAMEQERPGNLPTFDPAAPILVFSDYGGGHSAAHFESYAFFLTQPAILAQWETDRLEIRWAYGLANCSMAYKRLGAADRARALWPWLVAADGLDGLLVTVLVARSFGSMFPATGLAHLRQKVPEFRLLKDATIERVFRIAHFLSVFVAGLSSAQQELVWITDEDEIAANPSRLYLLQRTFARVSAMYLGRAP
jgi:hypothetical protein